MPLGPCLCYVPRQSKPLDPLGTVVDWMLDSTAVIVVAVAWLSESVGSAVVVVGGSVGTA